MDSRVFRSYFKARSVSSAIEALADLPSREVLIAKMLGSMNAPITGLVSVLGGTVRKLLYALNAVADAKGETAA